MFTVKRVLIVLAVTLATPVYPASTFAQSTLHSQLPANGGTMSAAAWRTFFDEQVFPIFDKHCGSCHGPDNQESELRLDNLESLRRGGDSGEPAIIPGDADQSHLLLLITAANPDERMPPDAQPLSSDDVAILRAWIESAPDWNALGLQSPANKQDDIEHWSFAPLSIPENPTPVASSNPSSFDAAKKNANGPLDAFILRRLAENGLSPSPAASRKTLIRRLYLDILGMPPTAEKARDFENDPSPNAYENLVATLLADPAYGERWGRYWLDLVRFAETDGYETNRERPNAWPFRDYVIASLNGDKPYDLFLQEQLAGDQLGAPVATGYLVAGTRDIVKSPDIVLTKTQRQNELDDIINTTGTAMLGLTFGCARCHNHKFDPITQSDYYALQAIFAGVQHGERPIPADAGKLTHIKHIEQQIFDLEKQLSSFRLDENAKRPSVVFTENTEIFPATEARYLKFIINKTTGAEPCIDELEVYSGQHNVALSTNGAIVQASGTLAGFAIHQREHLNDGKYGNEHSWISNTSDTGWVELSFPQPVEINRVVWGRDRSGRYSDRLATEYRIEVSMDRAHWQLVASSADRVPFGEAIPPTQYDFSHLSAADRQIWQERRERLNTLKKEREELKRVKPIYAGTFTQPEATHRLFRGDPMEPREEVGPNTVAFLGDLQLERAAGDAERRLHLAKWITKSDNPLTARVIVNRLWQHHFGTGLVATPSDFGKAGVEPSHPEVLDYLATTLINNDWSLKSIHREILLSATYRQSSHPNQASMDVDASNRWLWRFAPRRLEAEAIRDSILLVSGVLDRSMGGPGFSAFEVELENVRHYHPKSNYGPDDWRRMIYMTKVRQEQDSVFGIFDCPDGSSTVPARGRSTTPLQALNLFNSPFIIQQAELFADSLARRSPYKMADQITDAYGRCYARRPSNAELADAEKFIAELGLSAFCRALLNSNEFLFLQ